LAVQLIRRAFHLNIFICWRRIFTTVISAFYGVFIAEDFDGVGEKVSGYTGNVDV
jgi:hypothetical protein